MIYTISLMWTFQIDGMKASQTETDAKNAKEMIQS